MKLVLLSSLNNPEQRGGAFLRVNAIAKIYQELGFDVDIKYMDDYRPRKTLKGMVISFLLGVNLRSLFSRESCNFSNYDYIHLDNLKHFNWKIKRGKAKIIYNAHNLEHESFIPRYRKLSSFLFKVIEVFIMRKADIIFVCSSREKEIIKDVSSSIAKRVFVLPNLVDGSKYRSEDKKEIVLFLGTLDYFPNVKAIEFLFSNFYKNLNGELRNKYRYVIAGRRPLSWMKKMAKTEGVELHCDLSDEEIIDLLARTKVSLVPLSHGSGTRLKIIESILSKAYVLSTELGAEGIESNNITKTSLERFRTEFEALVEKVKVSSGDVTEFKREYDIYSWLDYNIVNLRKVMGLNEG